jgi:hypothetical protein
MGRRKRLYWAAGITSLVIAVGLAAYALMSVVRADREAADAREQTEGRAEADRDLAAGVLKIKRPGSSDEFLDEVYAALARQRFGAVVELLGEEEVKTHRVFGYQVRVGEEINARHGPGADGQLLSDAITAAQQKHRQRIGQR